MKTVHEVAKQFGVSVRTLHHYDAIGLLKPTCVTQAGYRQYDDAALARLQNILLFRQLRFSLTQIRVMLDNPGFDRQKALDDQIHLLELQRDYIDRILISAREMKNKGALFMEYQAFDHSKLDAYSEEVKQRWGKTEAYRESEKRTAGKSTAQMQDISAHMMEIFAEFGTLRGTDPGSEAAWKLTAKLQQFITDHYYHCTKEILAGLGEMYTSDDRFRENIDHAGGQGTAAFAAEAIRNYCK